MAGVNETRLYNSLRVAIAKFLVERKAQDYDTDETKEQFHISDPLYKMIFDGNGPRRQEDLLLLCDLADEIGIDLEAKNSQPWKFPIIKKNCFRSDYPCVIKLLDGTTTVAYPCEFEGIRKNEDDIDSFYHGRGYQVWWVFDNLFNHDKAFWVRNCKYVAPAEVIEWTALSPVKEEE